MIKMRKKIICPGAVSALMLMTVSLVSVSSCTKDGFDVEGGTEKVKEFSLVRGTEGKESKTSVTISGTSATVGWENADSILYWTGRTAPDRISGIKKKVIQTSDISGATLKFSLTYSDGDKSVTFLTKGGDIGLVDEASRDMSSFKIKNGVPAKQSGGFSDNHISVASAEITSNSAALKIAQALVRFRMSSTTFGDETVNRIVVTPKKSGENICGDMVISGAGTTSMSVTYANPGASIVIDKSQNRFYPNQDYYVAVMGGSGDGTKYAQGLLFTLQNVTFDASGSEVVKTLGDVYVNKANLVLNCGDILDLGELQTHKRIPTVAADVEVFPKYCAFTRDKNKKIWLKVEPSDFTGTVSWSSDNSTRIAVAALTDGGKPKKETITLEDGSTASCYVAEVKPGTNAGTTHTTEYAANITVTVTNPDETTITKIVPMILGPCVEVGMVMPFQEQPDAAVTGTYRILIARADIVDNSGTPALATDWGTVGSGYSWGRVLPGTVAKDWSYYIDNKKQFLRIAADEDVAYKWNAKYHVPRLGELMFMSSSTKKTVVGKPYSASTYVKFTGKKVGYTDVEFYVTTAGSNSNAAGKMIYTYTSGGTDYSCYFQTSTNAGIGYYNATNFYGWRYDETFPDELELYCGTGGDNKMRVRPFRYEAIPSL